MTVIRRKVCTDFDEEITTLQRASFLATISEDEMEAIDDSLEELLDDRTKAHVWVWIRDWEGDPSVYHGVHDLSHWECAECGADGGNGEEPKEEEE